MLSLSEQKAADVLGTALEGGVGYWSLADEIEYAPGDDVIYLSVVLHEAADAEEIDDDDLENVIEQKGIWGSSFYRKQGHKVTLFDVKRALREIAFGDVKYASDDHIKRVAREIIFATDPLDVDYDSDDADRIVQVAALGSVIYG